MLAPVPSTVVTLDFELYYSKDYNLRALTTEGYVRDARFEVIGVGVKVGGRPAVWMEGSDFETWLPRVPWHQVAVLAHHAHLEGLILSHHFNVRPGFWLDTLSMSRAVHGGTERSALEHLAELYGIGSKGKELEQTKGKRRRDFTPEEWLRFGVYGNNDVELTAQLLARMLPGFPLSELHLIDMTVRMFSEPSFVANQDVLRVALAAEREQKRQTLERVARYAGELKKGQTPLDAVKKLVGSSEKLAGLLRTLGVEPEMKEGKNGDIYAFASTDPAMQALLEHENPEVQALAEARVSVKSTIGVSRMERFLGIASRGAFPIYLKYAGAHTHRWSGGDSQNAQNMNRGGALRASLEAPPGHELVVADSGQIEPRVTGWLAGEESLMATFRRNDAMGKAGDIYSDEGSVYFRKPLSKEKTPVERQVSKNMIIGLGYNMGGLKFGTYLLAGMNGADPVQFGDKELSEFNVDVSRFEGGLYNPREEDGPTNGDMVRRLATRLPYAQMLKHVAVAAHLVRLYRAKNKRIVQLWKSMEQLLAVMAMPGGDPREVRQVFGPLRVRHEGLTLPGGLTLRYDKLRRTADGYRYWGFKEGRMQWLKVYGGLLTENVVQKIARDIVAEQALVVRAAGHRIATSSHDELVAVVPEGTGAACLEFMLKAMKVAPAWCQGLPLNASGGVGHSYGAVK